MMGCWGLFVGLLPPSFLQDEVEGLDRRDALYAGALAVVCLIVPLIVIPTVTSTAISEWTDRAFEVERLNVRENRPEVPEALARTADYYRQRGVEGSEQLQMSSFVLGGFVKTEAAAAGHPTWTATPESRHRRHWTVGDGLARLATQERGLEGATRRHVDYGQVGYWPFRPTVWPMT